MNHADIFYILAIPPQSALQYQHKFSNLAVGAVGRSNKNPFDGASLYAVNTSRYSRDLLQSVCLSVRPWQQQHRLSALREIQNRNSSQNLHINFKVWKNRLNDGPALLEGSGEFLLKKAKENLQSQQASF